YSVSLIEPSTAGCTCPSCHSGPMLCSGIQIRGGSAAQIDGAASARTRVDTTLRRSIGNPPSPARAASESCAFGGRQLIPVPWIASGLSRSTPAPHQLLDLQHARLPSLPGFWHHAAQHHVLPGVL